MIRRDYILRMIEEFVRVLARITSLKKERRWEEAQATVDEELKRLVAADVQTVSRLSETELLAKLIEGEPTQALRDKTLFLVALLKEAGDSAATQDRQEESRACYLKALHLLLDVLARGEVFEFPDFVPNIEGLVAALGDAPLPVRSQAMLMHHYERSGEFAKAEDALFGMIEVEPADLGIIGFGIAFYERLQGHADATLAAGGLPRPEVESGLAELRERQARLVHGSA